MPVHGGRSAGNARVGALERGGPRPRGCLALERGGPRSRGGVETSSEADPARGGVKGLERGGPRPRERLSLKRGGPHSRGIRCVALAGCGGHQGRGCVVRVF
jgi:hypothetical protein